MSYDNDKQMSAMSYSSSSTALDTDTISSYSYTAPGSSGSQDYTHEDFVVDESILSSTLPPRFRIL